MSVLACSDRDDPIRAIARDWKKWGGKLRLTKECFAWSGGLASERSDQEYSGNDVRDPTQPAPFAVGSV